MGKYKIGSFMKRVITTLILVPVVVGCILGGKVSVSLLALSAAVLLSWEWAHMLKGKSEVFFALVYLFVSAITIMVSPFYVGLGFIACLILLSGIYWRKEKELFLRLLGIFYIPVGIGSIVFIYNTYGVGIVLWYMVLVWCVDIGGYLFGSTLHGPKLAPKISPNKTWAGLFGGMLLAVIISVAACNIFGGMPYWVNAVILAGILTFIAQIGDLIESAIKRHLGLKDSSNLIPGHGGIFDRIDGLIFAAPFAYGLLKVLVVAFE